MTGNATLDHLYYLRENELCTFSGLNACPISLGFVQYVPNLAGNVFFALLFSLLAIAQIVLGVYWRTWTFAFSMFGGLVIEVVGYAGRCLMHNNPWSIQRFLMYVWAHFDSF